MVTRGSRGRWLGAASLIAILALPACNGIPVPSPPPTPPAPPTPTPTPPASPQIVDGKWQPALRGATNCCDDERTPDVDEGLADGWTLVNDAALDRINGPDTVNLTHVRLGPFSAALEEGSLGLLSGPDRAKGKAILEAVRRYGPGEEILDDARASGAATWARGMYIEWDAIDNWALVNSRFNLWGDTCQVTKGAPPERYLEWVKAVVEATWDLPGIYNLGNEGFRCRPSPEWERGLYDALKAALAAKGVTRPIGSTVTVADTRTAFDYRTFHGWFVPAAGWSRDIPAMLTETDNQPHDAAAWAALTRDVEERGSYVSIWRGPESWDSHNGAIAAMPKLGETWPPRPDQPCSPQLDPAFSAPPADSDLWRGPLSGVDSTRRAEVAGAIHAAQAACPSAWNQHCLVGGQASIDSGYRLIAKHLQLASVAASQGETSGGQRKDHLFVQTASGAKTWEEWKLFAYTDGCLAQTQYKGTHEYLGTAPPPTPPPSTGCSDPLPPKVDRWGGPKAHNRVNDSTPLFYGREAVRWDGTFVSGYCAALGMGDKLHCPARNECPGIKCEERAACEEIGVAGKPGGKPLWRSDGSVEVTVNPFQATCSSCTWLEVCAADGTHCSQCQIDQATRLCVVLR